MPVRSLSSSALRWPDADLVGQRAHQWATELLARDPDVVAAGYFGSYARGDWGVGSDLDLVVVTSDQGAAQDEDWQLERLPVPADLLTYTESEWRQLMASERRLARVLAQELVWLTPPQESGEEEAASG